MHILYILYTALGVSEIRNAIFCSRADSKVQNPSSCYFLPQLLNAALYPLKYNPKNAIKYTNDSKHKRRLTVPCK
jgi:hypothetical protein